MHRRSYEPLLLSLPMGSAAGSGEVDHRQSLLEREIVDLDPGKPQQNDFIRSINGSLCDKLLNEAIFDTSSDACRKLAL